MKISPALGLSPGLTYILLGYSIETGLIKTSKIEAHYIYSLIKYCINQKFVS